MRKFLLLILAGSMILTNTSCKKDGCKPRSPKDDEGIILKYAADNGITPVKDTTGLYYEIKSPGGGKWPTTSSVVKISYEGKLINNTVFDKQADPELTKWPLYNLIVGWQIGLPKIREGGRIILLVPSALAYGCQSPAPTIPSNSVLVFDITLVAVN